MRTRELAEPDVRALIEKQIISTAYKSFGDFHNKILLSLPPEEKCQGSINLGTIIYDKPKWPVGISRTELLQNLGIYGRSGSGKSNLFYHIIRQLDYLGINFLVFDQKRNLRDILSSFKNRINVYTAGRSLLKFNFNPFITPPALESSVYINQLVDVMDSAFTLGEGSKSLIQKAIFTCYKQGNKCPMTDDIIKEIDKIESKDRVRGWKLSALRALESLGFSNIASDPISQEKMTQKFINENTVIELDGLSNGARSFLIPVLYQWIFQVKLSSAGREILSMVIITDEAHIVFGKQMGRSSETLMERLLRMTRELGISNIILDQTPTLISKVVLANCYTNIFLNLPSVTDQALAASVYLFNSDEKMQFSVLPIGRAICKLQGKYTKAFLLEIPWVKFDKGSVTDAMLARYSSEISSKITHSPRKKSVPPVFDGFPRISFDVILEKPALQLLYDILARTQDGVRERYRRLAISDKKGHQIKERLLHQGWIESQIVELGQTRKVLLRLTKQAKETLGLDSEIPEYGSLVHEYWKRFYGRKFKRQGYKVDFEVPRKSGRVDAVAQKDDEKIAIEIETGKSNFIRNIQQDLVAKYS